MREHQKGHQCVCRLRLNVHPEAVIRDLGYDSCGVHVSNPDEPVCAYCVAAGHPRQDNFAPIIKEVQNV